MPFKKAVHEESRLKLGIYGPPGAGKTFTALLLAEGLVAGTGKRIAFLDTEKGTRHYDVRRPDAEVHPEPFDFDRLHTRSLAVATQEVERIDPKVHGVLIIDSISHLWDAAQDAVKERTRADTIRMQDWGKIKKPYKRFVDMAMHLPLDTIIIGRQKNLFEETASGELKKVGVTMRAEPETPHEPDIVFSMRVGREGGRSVYMAYFEKDRTSVLAGKTLRNPRFEDFAGLLPLLGRSHTPADSDGLDRDVDAIMEEEAQAARKAEESAMLLVEYQQALSGATTFEALKSIAAAIKKDRKRLTDEHRATLLALHEQVRTNISRQTAPTP